MTRNETDPQRISELRVLRHKILGRMNAIVLTASVLGNSAPDSDVLEDLRVIERCAEEVDALLSKLAALTG